MGDHAKRCALLSIHVTQCFRHPHFLLIHTLFTPATGASATDPDLRQDIEASRVSALDCLTSLLLQVGNDSKQGGFCECFSIQQCA